MPSYSAQYGAIASASRVLAPPAALGQRGVASGRPAARPSRTPPCARRCATPPGGHGRAAVGRLGREVVVDRPAGEERPLVEQRGVGGPDQLAEPLDDVLERGGVDVVGQRAVERAPGVGEVAQHQALAALQPVAPHERGEAVAALEHLAQDRLRRRLRRSATGGAAGTSRSSVEQLGERARPRDRLEPLHALLVRHALGLEAGDLGRLAPRSAGRGGSGGDRRAPTRRR